MAEVMWIKLATNIFDNRKIRQIETLPDGYSVIVVWLKLLCLAGNINDDGMVYFTKEIPYTDQMLSSQFNVPISTIQLSLKTFHQFGMVEIIDNILYISNWEKYQNIEGMDRIREQNRLRKQKQRENEKLMLCDMSRDVTQQIREDKKREDIYKHLRALYNETCVSFPKCTVISENRKKAINARLKTYTVDDFKNLFLKAESSSFLKGSNDRNWTATFDWLIKDSNMAKVLDGNYDNKETTITGYEGVREL